MEAAGIEVDVDAAQATLARVRRADGGDRDADLRAGGPDLQHQFRAAAPPGALRRAEAAVAPENARRRAEHCPGGARRAGPQAPVSGPLCSASPARQAQEHVSRCAAGAGASRRRPHPRVVQPERRGDRPAQLERPEPPEHPRADRGRPPDPPGVHRRASPAGCF